METNVVPVPENNTLTEIEDPVARAKLEGIQEAVYGIDGLILQLRKGIDEKRGVVAACDFIAKRIQDETLPVQKLAGEEKMPMDEAKIRIEVISKMANVVRSLGAENKNDLVSLQGQIVGLEKAAKSAEEKFNGETAKYQRWQRIRSEEDDLGRKAAEATTEDEQGAAKKPGSKATSKPKAKGAKAAK